MLPRDLLVVLVWIALSAWVGAMVFGVWVGVKVGELTWMGRIDRIFHSLSSLHPLRCLRIGGVHSKGFLFVFI